MHLAKSIENSQPKTIIVIVTDMPEKLLRDGLQVFYETVDSISNSY